MSKSEIWFSAFHEHWREFYQGRGFLDFDYRANDRIPNDQADLMESFLYAYRVTGDKKWLTEFARHAEGVLSKLGDIDGDGRPGWDTARYSLNLVENPNFEELAVTKQQLIASWDFERGSSDPTLPEDWTRNQVDSENVFRAAGSGVSNGFGIVLKPDGKRWIGLEWRSAEYLTNTSYLVTADARSDSEMVRPNIDVRIGATFLKTFPLTLSTDHQDGWSKIAFVFTTPETHGGTMIIRLVPSSIQSGPTLRFDNVELFHVADSGPKGWVQMAGEPDNVRRGSGYLTLSRGPDEDSPFIGYGLTNRHVSTGHNYEPKIRYRVRVDAKAEIDAGKGVIRVWDSTGSETLASLECGDVEWETYEFEFQAPEPPDHRLYLQLGLIPGQNGLSSVSYRNVKVQQYAGYIVTEGLVLNALLRFCNLVKADPGLSEFREKAELFHSLASEMVVNWEKDWVENDLRGAFIAPDDGSLGEFSRATLPTNMFLMGGLVMLRMNRYAANDLYRTRAEKMAQAFKASLIEENGAFAWDYYREAFPDNERELSFIAGEPEDLSHSNLDVAFALECYRQGIVFDDGDVDRFLGTFFKRIWDGDWDHPRLANAVSGRNYLERFPPVWWWLEWSELHPDVLGIISRAADRHIGINPKAPIHDELGVWYDQGWRILLKAMLAYYHQQAERRLLGPSLNIEVNANEIAVKWAPWLGDFELEQTSRLAPESDWKGSEMDDAPAGGWLNFRSHQRDASAFFRLKRR